MSHTLGSRARKHSRLCKATHVLLRPRDRSRDVFWGWPSGKSWRNSRLSRILSERLTRKRSRLVREFELVDSGLVDPDTGLTLGASRFPSRVKFYVVAHGMPGAHTITTDHKFPEMFTPGRLADLFESFLSQQQHATIALQNCYSGAGTFSFAWKFSAEMAIRGFHNLTVYAYPSVILYRANGPTLIATSPATADATLAASAEGMAVPGRPALVFGRLAREHRLVFYTRDSVMG